MKFAMIRDESWRWLEEKYVIDRWYELPLVDHVEFNSCFLVRDGRPE